MFRLVVIICVFFINNVVASPHVIIGIAGGTGSGKTTLARKIHEAFPSCSVVIPQDAYYKDFSHKTLSQRRSVNFDHPEALDLDLLVEHLHTLKAGHSVQMPIYDFHTSSRGEGYKEIDPTDVIIVEGILIFTMPALRDLFDMKVFIDTDSDIRILRRVERDSSERSRSFDSVKKQYLATVKPMHDTFVEPTKHHADIILSGNDDNTTALHILLAKIASDLAR